MENHFKSFFLQKFVSVTFPPSWWRCWSWSSLSSSLPPSSVRTSRLTSCRLSRRLTCTGNAVWRNRGAQRISDISWWPFSRRTSCRWRRGRWRSLSACSRRRRRWRSPVQNICWNRAVDTNTRVTIRHSRCCLHFLWSSENVLWTTIAHWICLRLPSSTSSTLFWSNFVLYLSLCWEKDENKQKRPGLVLLGFLSLNLTLFLQAFWLVEKC